MEKGTEGKESGMGRKTKEKGSEEKGVEKEGLRSRSGVIEKGREY